MSTGGGFRRVAIVGAGPAGAYLARLLVDDGFEVKVFEGAPRLASKPCGGGLPFSVERVLRVPEESVLVKVKGYKVYVGAKVSKESHGKFYGYIVDKESLLKYLLEGVEVVRKWTSPEKLQDFDLIVDARGHPVYSGKKALALQVEGMSEEIVEDEIQIYFFPEIVGYAWVFPTGDKRVKAGFGGLAEHDVLQRLLNDLIRRIRLREITGVKGSPIASGGLLGHYSDGVYRIGEALGAVMPLSGEGIRPSMITAVALHRDLTGQASFNRTISSFGLDLNLKVQLGILRFLEESPPSERAALLERAPQEILERVTAGTVTLSFLVEAAARWPGFFSKIAGKVTGLNIKQLTGKSD
ncbi:hypothetical protein MA03_04580 [Infirmifilum uzonense]|uniref:FAD-binding domain-containing protein n=1 Tax=Infirmifilum uzonense TaxID=1550241 RepID=A0A0F7FHN1_9CREN|nr:NAD(P)/FAD-dependent oxidoreductase [Infirmifilum uzonense]AKG38698.1 hypothetical protein MA03_04580 [Infirmifilum uzonense]